ncbi:hypothetical protein CH254_26320 [Rhodococcus sp. 06-412-2C]|uniref:DUF2399 domain-containing protein n=1 Tax=unclassified Rhodococcus (in: high G+C Gram-positive bacteria) TaxID=192944 RepID=UPI000B9A1D71|nr:MULTISPECIES: DUF2399 domain-containing protein [unclassified Rhodococcus (in: high G+C Gram-positive bacteria)]OZC81873.1 hypothetical protein CH254_26320 [Rhodococcus sp. 06-412-2C]OZC95901.1 hypothetical protein CH279_15760 [Rhodococcus sp. 06-412-2B]
MSSNGEWQGSAELSALLDAARKKLESNWLRVGGNITVDLSDAPELWRLCSAISRSNSSLHSRARSTKLDLERFDAWLSHPLNGGAGLIDTLTEQAPLQDKKRIAADKAQMRADALDRAREVLGGGTDREWIEYWIASLLNQDGTLGGRVAVDALAVATQVLALLPVDGMSLTGLAELATGDTKALAGGGAAKLVLDALSLRENVPRPVDPVGIRALWETAGVSVDALSSRVLVLGYRVAETHTVARWLNDAADEGVPFPVTVDMLARGPLTNSSSRVFVCENIAVLAAAARTLGSSSASLICTDGQPSAAVHRLLASRAPDTAIEWRADFDWAGLHMVQRAVDRYGASPWRMDVDSYRHGLDARNSEPLKGHPTDSQWDPELAAALRDSGRAVMEDRLIPDLLADLRLGPAN